MRKFAVIGTALALLAGTTAAVSVASASAAPKHAAADSATVLHLISHQKSLQVIDIGQKGPSPADEVIETTLDFQHGTPVDRSVINCVLIKLTGRVMHVPCHGAMIFKDGLVQISGETDFHTPFTVAVTGGTGAYQNAGGQLTAVRTIPHTTTDVLTLRLVFLKPARTRGDRQRKRAERQQAAQAARVGLRPGKPGPAASPATMLHLTGKPTQMITQGTTAI